MVVARYVLDGLGLDMHKDFDAVLLESAKDGPPMILNGEAAAMWGGGLGWPGFEAVALGPQGARCNFHLALPAPPPVLHNAVHASRPANRAGTTILEPRGEPWTRASRRSSDAEQS